LKEGGFNWIYVAVFWSFIKKTKTNQTKKTKQNKTKQKTKQNKKKEKEE
jgi:hypothetical protein